jgi:hypothetical protein
VARGGGAVAVRERFIKDGETEVDESLRHSITSSGISSKKREGGL